MKIPPFLRTKTVQVKNAQAEGAYGTTHAASRDVKVYVEYKQRVLVSSQGADVTSEAILHCDPSEDIPLESLVTVDGHEMRVLRVARPEDLAGVQEVQVMVG